MFIESLGGAQFAVASTVDRLRNYLDNVDQSSPDYTAIVLAATDHGNPYGVALPWPEAAGHRPGRKAGALVAAIGQQQLVWFLDRADRCRGRRHAGTTTRGGRCAGRPGERGAAAESLLIEKVNGQPVLRSTT